MVWRSLESTIYIFKSKKHKEIFTISIVNLRFSYKEFKNWWKLLSLSYYQSRLENNRPYAFHKKIIYQNYQNIYIYMIHIWHEFAKLCALLTHLIYLPCESSSPALPYLHIYLSYFCVLKYFQNGFLAL